MNRYLLLTFVSVFSASMPSNQVWATHVMTPWLWAQAAVFALLYIGSCIKHPHR